MESDTPSPASSGRVIKRKLEDAIHALDDAIVSPSLAAIERPTPPKRPHLSRSVYSTLTKLGVVPKERSRPPTPTDTDASKGTPHLTAILARSASRQNSSSSFIAVPPAHPASEYMPSSTDSFLARLATYKITTYANKPPQIDAVAAARCGWANDRKDRLICGICDVSWVLADREGMNKDAAIALLEKQRAALVEMHKDGCPWKARQCDVSVYRVPLQTPTAMVRKLRVTALSLGPMLADIAIKHPLTPTQLSSLRSIFSPTIPEGWPSDSAINLEEAPTETAALVALFGWVPASNATYNEPRCTSFPSISRARAHGPSASLPPIRSLSCASSVSSRFRESESMSTPSTSPPRNALHPNPSADCVGRSSRVKNSSSSISNAVSHETPLVHCTLCQRRVGLWGYSRTEATTSLVQSKDSALASGQQLKEFDLVKEHRSYCPYIVCSSVAPSFSHSPAVDSLGTTIEGWRAVLTVVQRYELSQRQRLSRFIPGNSDNQVPSAELRGIEAMVAGVKTRGGRELMRYVKGLLG